MPPSRGLEIHGTACAGVGTDAALPRLPEAAEPREVANADIVVAAYDALFTGFAMDAEPGPDPDRRGLLARAEERRSLWVETAAADLAPATRPPQLRKGVRLRGRPARSRRRVARRWRSTGRVRWRSEALRAAGAEKRTGVPPLRWNERQYAMPGSSPAWTGRSAGRVAASKRNKAISRARRSLAGTGRAARAGREGRVWVRPTITSVLGVKPAHVRCSAARPASRRDAQSGARANRAATPRGRRDRREAPNMPVNLVAGSFGKGSSVPTSRDAGRTAAPIEPPRRMRGLRALASGACGPGGRWSSLTKTSSRSSPNPRGRDRALQRDRRARRLPRR